MVWSKKEIGEWGEREAARFLKEKGYHIVETNFQVREGEIDIIGWHDKPHFGKTLCFVEVKTRGGESGSAERAAQQGGKVGKMMHAARAYCIRNHIDTNKTPIQFELVSVYGSPGGLKDIRQYEMPA